MAKVVIGAALARWLPPGSGDTSLVADGDSLLDVLESVFERLPTLRGYVLDDSGAVRHHVAIFVDGQAHVDKRDLDIPLARDAEVYLMQALSGG
jgi:sulfur-carrier protein